MTNRLHRVDRGDVAEQLHRQDRQPVGRGGIEEGGPVPAVGGNGRLEGAGGLDGLFARHHHFDR